MYIEGFGAVEYSLRHSKDMVRRGYGTRRDDGARDKHVNEKAKQKAGTKKIRNNIICGMTSKGHTPHAPRLTYRYQTRPLEDQQKKLKNLKRAKTGIIVSYQLWLYTDGHWHSKA